MEINFGIQPNCSECALVIYSDKINQKQRSFLMEFFKSKQLLTKDTPLGNIAIDMDENPELGYKDDFWKIRDAILEISKFNNLDIEEEKQFDLIRDDSWYDLIEEKRI